MRTYIGLDLSTVSTGWSVFKDGKLSQSGVIRPKNADVMTRIVEIADRLSKVVANVQAEGYEVVIEDTFYKKNYKTTVVLNRLGGAVFYMLMSTPDIRPKIGFVTATGARKRFGLLPTSSKKNIIDAVNARLGLNLADVDDDEADAIVLGCYGVLTEMDPSASFDKTSNDFFKSGVKTPRIKRSKRNAKGKA